MNVAIIGAGAAGLVSARFCTDPSFNFTCEIFEQMDQVGGTWIYTPSIGVDEYNIPIHTSMYKGLITNLPKEIMEFPDFKFPNYEKSYITQRQVLKYLQDYAKYHNIEQYIKYRHLVKQISPLPDNKWSITVTNLKNQTDITKEFHAVLICNGHYSKIVVPKIAGQHIFKGKQIHSHDYRCAEDFHDKVVLIIGAGPSGIDITFGIAKYASKVILSHRTEKLNITFASNVILKPTTKELTESAAFFSDGTTEKIDALIYCTGYEYSFPFLTEECGIKAHKNFIQPLYKHVVNIERSSMGFIGLPFAVMPFPMFHYQVLIFLKHIKGEINLPTKEEMFLDRENDLKQRREKGFPEIYNHKLSLEFQELYFQNLAKLAQVKPLPPVKFKIYADNKIYKKIAVYRIIDDENFIKTC